MAADDPKASGFRQQGWFSRGVALYISRPNAHRAVQKGYSRLRVTNLSEEVQDLKPET
jgi:hypothetical protein